MEASGVITNETAHHGNPAELWEGGGEFAQDRNALLGGVPFTRLKVPP